VPIEVPSLEETVSVAEPVAVDVVFEASEEDDITGDALAEGTAVEDAAAEEEIIVEEKVMVEALQAIKPAMARVEEFSN
jgi:hypothetical protein